MKKYYIYIALALAGSLGIFASCDQDRDVADVISPANKAVVTIEYSSGPNTGTLPEADEDTIVYNVTIDKMQEFPVTVTARQIGGTADADDYTVIDATIAPYSTTGKLLVIINKDIQPEELETLEFEVGPFDVSNNWQLNLEKVTNQGFSLSVDNFVSNDLLVTLAWEQGIEIDDTVRYACDSVDLDMYVAPAEGFDISDPWAGEIPSARAATGDCPEEMTISGLADGTYVIFANLWVNRFNPFGVDTPLPITATFTREGVFLDKVFVQSDENAFNSDMPGEDDPEYVDGDVSNIIVAMVTIENGTYTINGPDGDEVASGRMRTGSKSRRPASVIVNK